MSVGRDVADPPATATASFPERHDEQRPVPPSRNPLARVLAAPGSATLFVIAVPTGLVVVIVGLLARPQGPLTWYVPALDVTTSVTLGAVAALAAVDMLIWRDRQSLPVAATAVAVAIAWLVHLTVFPGVFVSPQDAGLAAGTLYLVTSVVTPVLLGWAVLIRPGVLKTPVRALTITLTLAAGLAVIGAIVVVAISGVIPHALDGNRFTPFGRAIGAAALIPATAALTLLLWRRRPAGDIIPGLASALVLQVFGAISIGLTVQRYDGNWYAAHGLRFLATLALLIGQLLNYARSARAERDAGDRLRSMVAELRESEASLAEAQRLTHLGSWEWDIKTNTVQWSEELWSIYGLAQRGLGLRYEEFLERVYPADRGVVDDTIQRAFHDARPFLFHHRIVRPDGRVRVLRAMGRVIVGEDGRAARMVGTGQDITELEETLRQHADRMEALEKLKAEFLLLASHELRGPLAVVRGYVALLQDGSLGDLPARAQSILPTLASKGHEMNRLINEMLLTARMEEEGLELRMEAFDLRDLAAAAVDSVRGLAGPSHTLVTDFGDQPVPVMVDREQMVTVLVNLLDNAIKFSPAGGRVTCTVEPENDRAIASVRDEGLGIEAAHQHRLFTRFGRLVTAENSHIPGTGLGLYLARELVRRHAGDITVESQPGRGSLFTVTLPLGGVPPRQPAGNEDVGALAT